ncbi:nitrate reductase molybdenum cofactor assembly chaperone [Bosea sp. (in: a-proteobacteria)]|jgi:nitrate reductase delta subunit|uniref:nitrate reductase molybdenum cofactor assembly chaperone n=1 Tax=Bosea sp. (in: a-proteobacteria) TaxID=1871050 RepID=UPI00086C7269|nr:nitrate reductase molybdenum cofactor assembly chaperone [Bosea sp. (in: a-proteobacteria)]MBN9439566.1 nitrate reductase molybdenum cofactor assembly chaperone [Bosea sp. (in: a-proteobacteria)]MBN9446884.1 nitrate reductase molybdenum cofactor assembly chaperone [Bosea sp. (in: a-proteobacteria)]MBN9468496.1 nitrate reductase molybdenum cofactor assembly chaperone [Bosea sp. (in: a-proteobacteria)]ODT55954.1 MAG: nitrate reductase molybdenum cofactor assembly chaperone [Methylobacterium sp
MKTLKAFSALLNYPSRELVAAIPEIRSVLAEEAVVDPAALEPLLRMLEEADLYDAQERYVMLFDRTRSLSLHLFEHVHGESRDRGQAMVDLKSVYEAAGFTIEGTELPDFVPLFLEYCSLLPAQEARVVLADPAHVMTVLGERLRKRETPYAVVFEALVALAATKPAPEVFEAIVPETEQDPNDLAALDAAWEEEEVRFGPGAGADCGVENLAAKLRQAKRPAPGLGVATVRRPKTRFTYASPRD